MSLRVARGTADGSIRGLRGVSSALPLISVVLLLLAARVLTALVVVGQPGYTDAFYYVDVARRLAHGEGLSADFVWNFLEAPGFSRMPVPSHRFWMPLASVEQAVGIALFEPLVGTFRAAQAVVIAVAAFVPVAGYAAARSIGASAGAALSAAALTGIGAGFFAPAWVTLDSFGTAAILGTVFFIIYRRVAAGDVRFGALAGSVVGLLYLARAEGALFGIALLVLMLSVVARRAAIVGVIVALTIGVAWFARGLAIGGSPELLARTVLLARYEEFFSLHPTATLTVATFIGQRLNALLFDFGVAMLTLLGFLALPLVHAARARWQFPAVRAFVGLAIAIYLADSLVWPLHAVRGSYVHSLAAFYPFAMALAATGGALLLRGRPVGVRRIAVGSTLTVAVIFAISGVSLWSDSFNEGARIRQSVVGLIPAGPFLASDAAAWRWIADRPVLITPADGLSAAACVAAAYGANSVVLEAAHFSAYDDLYRGVSVPWLEAPIEGGGGVKIFPIRGRPPC